MSFYITPNLCLFFTAVLVSLFSTPLAKKIATKLGAVDYPDSRRINEKPTPRMGGISILLGVICAFAVLYVATSIFEWPDISFTNQLQINYPLLALSFVVVFLVGAIDDVYGLKPRQKLIGQIIAAIIAVLSGLVIGVIVDPTGAGDVIELGWFAYPITVAYLVAYVNIINLIDGLDGLAAGISCIASSTLCVLATWSGHLDAASLAITIAGASLGFLGFNFHPASIFMGDCGSHFLGFTLGSISLMSVTRVAGLTTIMMPLMIAGIPILDTLSAIIRRTRAHVSVGHADTGHIHHRLLRQGYDQRQTVLVIYGWTAILSLGALVMVQLALVPRILVFALLLAGSAFFAFKLRLFEPVLLHHYNPRTGKDELIGPKDAAFKEEAEAFAEEHEHHLPFTKHNKE